MWSDNGDFTTAGLDGCLKLRRAPLLNFVRVKRVGSDVRPLAGTSDRVEVGLVEHFWHLLGSSTLGIFPRVFAAVSFCCPRRSDVFGNIRR